MNIKQLAFFGASPLVILTAAQSANAGDTTTLDFEDFNTGNLGTAALFNLPDLNVRFDLEEPILSLIDFGESVQGWGNRTLLFNSSIQTPLTISFLDGATAFGIEYGDFGADADTISFSIYSEILGTGDLLGTFELITTNHIGVLGPDLFEFATVDGSLSIGSVIIETAGVGGGPSLFFDNLSVTTPTPPAVSLLLAAGLLTTRRRRMNKPCTKAD